GLTDYLVLHPHWMYDRLTRFWEGRAGVTHLEQEAKFEPLPQVETHGATIPQNYVAVRFYARTTFPFGDAARTVAVETVKKLAQQQTVVLLNSGIHADDHVDFDIPDLPNVLK